MRATGRVLPIPKIFPSYTFFPSLTLHLAPITTESSSGVTHPILTIEVVSSQGKYIRTKSLLSTYTL